MLGREPMLAPDGRRSTDAKGRRSYVTSAGAGPSLGKHILMAYLPPEHASRARSCSSSTWASVPGHGRVVGSTPIFDPENARIRS